MNAQQQIIYNTFTTDTKLSIQLEKVVNLSKQSQDPVYLVAETMKIVFEGFLEEELEKAGADQNFPLMMLLDIVKYGYVIDFMKIAQNVLDSCESNNNSK